MNTRNIMLGKALDLIEHKREFGNKKNAKFMVGIILVRQLCGTISRVQQLFKGE